MKCESPIEEKMLAGLLSAAADPRFAGRVMIRLQAKMGPYRVDFALGLKIGDKVTGVIVECDGHDFHERTKEQATRDKRRDRWLQSGGWTVLRFTGAEIWADAFKCANEALDTLSSLAERQMA